LLNNGTPKGGGGAAELQAPPPPPNLDLKTQIFVDKNQMFYVTYPSAKISPYHLMTSTLEF